jgi:hypothetical protein
VEATPGDLAILILLRATAPVAMVAELMKSQNFGIARILRMGREARSEDASRREDKAPTERLNMDGLLGRGLRTRPSGR